VNGVGFWYVNAAKVSMPISMKVDMEELATCTCSSAHTLGTGFEAITGSGLKSSDINLVLSLVDI